jgi:GR25 family glycosyltransferase involved in LPS biosynthesis
MPRRFEKMSQLAKAAGIPLQAWDGVMITKDQLDTLPPQGVGTTNYRDRTGTISNLGVIGAFLGHRNLLQHIADKGQGKPGTFISEDDIDIHPDFYTKLNAVEAEIAQNAADWDIIFLDKNLPTISGVQVSPHLMKLNKDISGYKNWGI